MVTKQQIKDILQLSDTTYDEFIERMLPLVDGVVKRYCRNNFLRNDRTECYPRGIELGYATLINSYMMDRGLVSKSCGDVVKTYKDNDTLMKDEFTQFRSMYSNF